MSEHVILFCSIYCWWSSDGENQKIKLSRCVDLLSESCEFVSNGDPVSNILLSYLSQLISEFIWWCPIRSNGWGNICSASISLFLYRCWYLNLKVLYLYLIWDLIYLARTNCARIEATLETYFSVPDSSSEDRQFYIWVTKSVLSGWGCIWIIPDASYAMYLYFFVFLSSVNRAREKLTFELDVGKRINLSFFNKPCSHLCSSSIHCNALDCAPHICILFFFCILQGKNNSPPIDGSKSQGVKGTSLPIHLICTNTVEHVSI